MPYNSYESVENLDTSSQRALFFKGDSVEKIWAAWALGLKLGRKMIPDLMRSLYDSHEPGVRRHLLVVLSALGERSVLDAIATKDPDEFVRATAWRYLIRTAKPHDSRVQQLLLRCLSKDPSLEVRLTILQEAEEKLFTVERGHLG